VKKKVIFCLSVALMLALLSMVPCCYSTVYSSSTADIESVALQFLGQVAGFNTSNYQIALSAPSGPYRMLNTQVTPHFATHVSATVSNEYGESDVVLSFIDGNFRSYGLHSLQGNLNAHASEQGFNDSLNTLITVVNGCRGLFNASYWSDFAQLVSVALQTQQLRAENENFLLEIENGSTLWTACYAKIDGQYTSPFRSMQVHMSSTGLVTSVIDGMMIYHVATTNVTVSEEQAIAIAGPYIETFAQQNQQQVTAINATFRYEIDGSEQRGDSFAIYPQWTIEAWYDKPGEYNVTSYSVVIWADNSAISRSGPVGFFEPAPGNAQPNLPLLLIPAAIPVFALASGVYLHRKRRRK